MRYFEKLRSMTQNETYINFARNLLLLYSININDGGIFVLVLYNRALLTYA